MSTRHSTRRHVVFALGWQASSNAVHCAATSAALLYSRTLFELYGSGCKQTVLTSTADKAWTTVLKADHSKHAGTAAAAISGYKGTSHSTPGTLSVHSMPHDA